VPITVADPFKGRQYPGEVILQAVRWYLRYPLAYEHLAELLAERRIPARVHLLPWIARSAVTPKLQVARLRSSTFPFLAPIYRHSAGRKRQGCLSLLTQLTIRRRHPSSESRRRHVLHSVRRR